MKEMYSIVQREVNPLTAKIKVRVCESGTKEELTRGINLLSYQTRKQQRSS